MIRQQLRSGDADALKEKAARGLETCGDAAVPVPAPGVRTCTCTCASSSGFVSPLLPHFPNAAVSPECQSLNEAAALDSGETKEEVAMVTEATETGSSSCPESLLPGEAVVAGRAFPRHSAALPSVLLPAGFRKVTGSVVTHRAQKRDMKPVRCLHSGCIPLALSHISSLPPPPSSPPSVSTHVKHASACAGDVVPHPIYGAK